MSLNLNSPATAILVCHLQRDIIENDQALGAVFGAEAARRQAVSAAGRLIDAARTGFALPALLGIAWRPDLSNTLDNVPLARRAAGRNACIDGQPGAEFVCTRSRWTGDIVVTHHLPTPFHGTDLQAIL
jgi:nicotinamidase-related amidase